MTTQKDIIDDAETAFREAAASTGTRAEELRKKGEALLEKAKAASQAFQEDVLNKGKDAARATDDYVQSNPWAAVGIAAGVGLVLGLLLNRDK